jgi:predicted HAD superfamily Cof-like phosphohydrolase
MTTYPSGSVFLDVEAFNRKLAPRQVRESPQWRDQDIMDLRWRLIDEEVNTELKQAFERRDLVELVDATLDSIYVLAGLLTAVGVKGQPIWDAIHRANMRKEGGEMREDGKVLKPEGWKHPNIEEFLQEQGQRYQDGLRHLQEGNFI